MLTATYAPSSRAGGEAIHLWKLRDQQCFHPDEVQRNGKLGMRLTSRATLVKMKRDLENQIRGLLKIAGLLVGTARGNAKDRMETLQELADEAFRDLLKKHRRPTTLKDMLRESVRSHPANDHHPPAHKTR